MAARRLERIHAVAKQGVFYDPSRPTRCLPLHKPCSPVRRCSSSSSQGSVIPSGAPTYQFDYDELTPAGSLHRLCDVLRESTRRAQRARLFFP